MIQVGVFLVVLEGVYKIHISSKLTKVSVSSIVLTYHWNYFMVEYLIFCWLSECCEGGKVPGHDAGEAPGYNAVDVFLAVLEGVYKINNSCDTTDTIHIACFYCHKYIEINDM